MKKKESVAKGVGKSVIALILIMVVIGALSEKDECGARGPQFMHCPMPKGHAGCHQISNARFIGSDDFLPNDTDGQCAKWIQLACSKQINTSECVRLCKYQKLVNARTTNRRWLQQVYEQENRQDAKRLRIEKPLEKYK